jgi:hypothetical protein
MSRRCWPLATASPWASAAARRSGESRGAGLANLAAQPRSGWALDGLSELEAQGRPEAGACSRSSIGPGLVDPLARAVR